VTSIAALVEVAEGLADSPDPIDNGLAVLLSYLVVRAAGAGEQTHDDLVRVGFVTAMAWQRAHSDGSRLLALPVLDRVLLLASCGDLDVDARDLDEINRARMDAGEPFWAT